jgi:glycosyltransferase involved in cell wall biosynthesis
MSDSPRVSVLMPVYNSGRFVELACASIMQQSFRDFELIVLDDGSTDDSLRRVRAMAAREPRMVVVARENRGLIVSRNELLDRARAPLLAWMDSDDVALPARLARQVETFDAHPELDCLGTAVLEVDPEGQPIIETRYPADHEGISLKMSEGGAMRFPTTMMRRQAVIDVGGFREPFKVGEDFDLFLRLMERRRVANLTEVLLLYRLHTQNTSGILSSRWLVYRDAILALAEERRRTGSDRLQRGEPLSLSFPTDPGAEQRTWESHRLWARLALTSGYLRSSWKHTLKALALAPHKVPSWKLLARVSLETSKGLPWGTGAGRPGRPEKGP